ncbi:ACP S-malonyltransferase [Acidipropionibacterium jensenii]|uniref:ACP S-malonyltransferase n=1 Tax=Acidipropionibacterium jensenii TaxID=1749 RepID=UPI000BC34F29|nr:ACP S-malonyltransferase [Acidipropionibacterium jensenii]AZZ42949.1 ACP S-malonyltransferase [Acidipropionibacterium jensenii]
MSAGALHLFPGQGSQAKGMGRRALEHSPQARRFVEEASRAVDLDLEELCLHASLAELTPTQVQQPALTAAALADWIAFGPPTAGPGDRFAGHSIGALAAAAASGYLDLVEAVRLARLRGRLMSQAPGRGSMLAVISSRSESQEAQLAWARTLSEQQGLDVAAVNGPTQIVLSGDLDRVEEAARALPHATVLRVSHGFHSRLMEPAQPEWTAALERTGFADGSGYVGCTTGVTAGSPQDVRRDLREGLRHTVRWPFVLTATADCTPITVYGPGRTIARLQRPYLSGRTIRLAGGGGR